MSESSGAGQEDARFQRTRDALAGEGSEAQGEAGFPSLSGTAERLRQMLVTAEDVSQDIRREANEEAQRYLAERRREADALVASRRQHLEQALETLRSEGREIERRVAAVTEALERALDDPLVAEHSVAEPSIAEPSPAPRVAAEASAEVAVEVPAAVEPVEAPAAKEEAPAGNREADGKAAAASAAHARQRALIRATQLAVQGADRAVVQEKLEQEFELDDTASIVEEILGSE